MFQLMSKMSKMRKCSVLNLFCRRNAWFNLWKYQELSLYLIEIKISFIVKFSYLVDGYQIDKVLKLCCNRHFKLWTLLYNQMYFVQLLYTFNKPYTYNLYEKSSWTKYIIDKTSTLSVIVDPQEQILKSIMYSIEHCSLKIEPIAGEVRLLIIN